MPTCLPPEDPTVSSMSTYSEPFLQKELVAQVCTPTAPHPLGDFIAYVETWNNLLNVNRDPWAVCSASQCTISRGQQISDLPPEPSRYPSMFSNHHDTRACFRRLLIQTCPPVLRKECIYDQRKPELRLIHHSAFAAASIIDRSVQPTPITPGCSRLLLFGTTSEPVHLPLLLFLSPWATGRQ